jgi:hypothetical protein
MYCTAMALASQADHSLNNRMEIETLVSTDGEQLAMPTAPSSTQPSPVPAEQLVMLTAQNSTQPSRVPAGTRKVGCITGCTLIILQLSVAISSGLLSLLLHLNSGIIIVKYI